jgi:hypothetical protein
MHRMMNLFQSLLFSAGLIGMAIVNSVKTVLQFGNPTEYVNLLAQNVPINATTTFALTGFVNYVRSGKVRFKVTAAPASSQITGIKITATDGTTTVTLYQDATARTAAELVDLLFSFISELNLTTVNVLVTLANAGSAMTADLEITGNP